MHLSQKDIELFFSTWFPMLWDVNEMKKIIPPFKKLRYGGDTMLTQKDFYILKDAIWTNPEWIDEYLLRHRNDGSLSKKERALLSAWRQHFIYDSFILVKHLKDYSVFMQTKADGSTVLYGASGISDPLEVMVRFKAPLRLSATLIPFGEKIIIDGFFAITDKDFSPEEKQSFNDLYQQTKAESGIKSSFY